MNKEQKISTLETWHRIQNLRYFRYRNHGISLIFKVSYTIISELMLEKSGHAYKELSIYQIQSKITKSCETFSPRMLIKQLFTIQNM